MGITSLRSHRIVRVFILVALAVSARGKAPLAGEARWDVATSDTRISIRTCHDGPVICGLKSPDSHHDWAGDGMQYPLIRKVWIGEQPIALSWTFEGAVQDNAAGTLTLTFRNAAPAMVLRSVWRGRCGRGPIEHWMHIENASDQRITLSSQDSLSLGQIQSPGPAKLWWIKRGGTDARIQGGTVTQALTVDLDLVLTSNCNEPSSAVPWLAVQVAAEEGLYVGWVFSGLGRIRVKTGSEAQSLSVHVGNEPDFRTDIGPGETFWVPTAFVGCYVGDIDEGSYGLHRYVVEALRPEMPGGAPDPILAYNAYMDVGAWYATEADTLRNIRLCQELGFEVFVLDAMWFPTAGDWRFDPQRFPNGFAGVEKAVNAAGLKLGQWCAWAQGGDSTAPGALNVKDHLEWFSTVGNDAETNRTRNQFCLACLPAKQWAINETQRIVGTYHLDYFKHDGAPIQNTCTRTSHRHTHGVDVGYWSALGYYEVQDNLLAKFPGLILENCAQGGHQKDFGVITRSHYTCTTDVLSNLADRQSVYDSTFAFPPILLQAYTYENFYNVRGDRPESFLWRSAMMSAWQIDPTGTLTWTDADRDSARRAVSIYKNWIRPILKDVKVHHILPRPTGRRWDGMFYWSPRLSRGTLYIFRPSAREERRRIALKGLNPAHKYWVWGEDCSVAPGIRTGQTLMDRGLEITLPQRYSSDLVYVQDACLGQPEGISQPGGFELCATDPTSDFFFASAELKWKPSTAARSYIVTVSESPDFSKPWFRGTCYRPSISLRRLPPSRTFFWRVQAVAWGGKRGNEGDHGTFATPALKPLPGMVFASDMEWAASRAGANNVVFRDSNYSGKRAFIGGRPYEKAIWTHANKDATPAEVVVDIRDCGYSRFVSDVGLDDLNPFGSVSFEVFVDNTPAAKTPVLHRGQCEKIDVDVTGAKQISLRVYNGGDGCNGDHAVWGFARFITKGARDPLPRILRSRQ